MEYWLSEAERANRLDSARAIGGDGRGQQRDGQERARDTDVGRRIGDTSTSMVETSRDAATATADRRLPNSMLVENFR
ncbi:MAG TPA: hypothetical protein VM820_05525 [Vicinamibacterales bacterium]|nr:hypothetical protein [Vicinamibacterales bacterium]